MSFSRNNFFFADETLQPKFQAFLKAPVAIFPLGQALGPKNVLDGEDDGSNHAEYNIAYDPLWVPTGQFGSPLFSGTLRSYITLDLSSLFTNNVKAFSMLMWVRPSQFGEKTLLVSFSFCNQFQASWQV